MEWVAGCSWNPWPDHRGARSLADLITENIEIRRHFGAHSLHELMAGLHLLQHAKVRAPR